MEWLNKAAPALQAIAGIASVMLTVILAWVTYRKCSAHQGDVRYERANN